VRNVTVPFFISHQGCQNTCIFCDQQTISGSPGNVPSAELILEKIQLWRRSAGIRPLEVAFFGGTFTALPTSVQEQLLEPLQPLLATGVISSVRISTRPDSITSDAVRRLAQQGVTTIEIGVQSMDDGVLEQSGRGHTAADSEAAIRCIRACGLSAGAQLMPGLPGDTPIRSLQSLKRVIAAGASCVRIYPVVVLRGTELARRYRAGEYRPLCVADGVQLCKLLLHESLLSGIDVIRIGLQADTGLNDDTVLAGCWHPAFGQLVRSELYFDMMSRLLSGLPSNQLFSVRCHPSRISDVVGHERKNMVRLKDRLLPNPFLPDHNLPPEEIVAGNSQHSVKGNLLKNLKYTLPKEQTDAQRVPEIS
jgi:histone acetyltransferase (RNA polymerase elongator complex component)